MNDNTKVDDSKTTIEQGTLNGNGGHAHTPSPNKNGTANGPANGSAGNALASAGIDHLPSSVDLVCLSHLRWGFVYQRPQHLLSRWAKERRVFFVEEPILGEGEPRLQIVHDSVSGVRVVVPVLPHGLDAQEMETTLAKLIDTLFIDDAINEHILWYYTPMALGFTQHLTPLATVYDCMDELSAFKGAPREMVEREKELFDRADLVFTGGVSLYEAKREKHSNAHPFPSSVERAHFGIARELKRKDEPEDQKHIPHPRIGFFGVIDERLDIDLLRIVAEARPDWHFVMIGPVVKIDQADLPQRPNIHYLGGKDYAELPYYLAGWDVAMLPFARNESTKFISPTKTPEYLAAGKPVVSTPIRDVVRPYGEMGLVAIAGESGEFIAAVESLLAMEDRESWLARVDEYLADMSWDHTWSEMKSLIEPVACGRRASASKIAELIDGAGSAPRDAHSYLQGI